MIGEGTYGNVAKVYCSERQEFVAIKSITGFSKNNYSLLKVVREIQLMKELNKMPEGSKYIPILHDVIVAESKK